MNWKITQCLHLARVLMLLRDAKAGGPYDILFLAFVEGYRVVGPLIV